MSTPSLTCTADVVHAENVGTALGGDTAGLRRRLILVHTGEEIRQEPLAGRAYQHRERPAKRELAGAAEKRHALLGSGTEPHTGIDYDTVTANPRGLRFVYQPI